MNTTPARLACNHFLCQQWEQGIEVLSTAHLNKTQHFVVLSGAIDALVPAKVFNTLLSTIHPDAAVMVMVVPKIAFGGQWHLLADVLKRVPLATDLSNEFNVAVRSGPIGAVKKLRPFAAQSVVNRSFGLACGQPHGGKVVEALFAHVTDFHTDVEADALSNAVIEGNVPLVTRLLGAGANPKAFDSLALRWASSRLNGELVDVLYPVSDGKTALAVMKDDGENEPLWWELLEQRILKDTLEKQTRMAHTGKAARRRKL